MNRAESSRIRMLGKSSALEPLDQGVALVSTLASGRPDRSDLGREYITGKKTLMLSDSVKGLAFVFRWCYQPGFSSALLSPRTLCSGTAKVRHCSVFPTGSAPFVLQEPS